MFEFRALLIAIPLLPLLATFLTAILGAKLLREKSHWPCILALALSFLCSCVLLAKVQQTLHEGGAALSRLEPATLWTWALVEATTTTASTTGMEHAFRVPVTLRADTLTAIMLCMVTLVSSLVAIYSRGYMHGDRSYWRFFTYLSLFVFSMTMLVLVSNFLLLFVFWEAVGACSYLLIGFWYEKPAAAAAGKKAFLVNRVGDFGFALAIFLIWTTYGSLNYHDTPATEGSTAEYGVLGEARLSGEVEFATGGTALTICLLLMLGACGKSAQIPLHVWLPDAMEGPTPVSALIHAATMVTAGVYLVARCTPLFMVSPDAQLTVACIGGVTALMAGIIAMTQHDLKRVLAYSTVSQLGYMFLALGTGTVAGIAAAMFHLITHAFFKALLFLGAGSVMHGMGNVIDMRRFGGLRRIMPITCVTFLIGCSALAGIPPLSGFWSKDAILGAVHDRIHEADHALHDEEAVSEATHHAPAAAAESSSSIYRAMEPQRIRFHRQTYQWLYGMAVATAFLTAFYTFRAFFGTFLGEPMVPEEAAGHARESPPSMWIPLAVLSVLALFAGLVMHVQGHPDAFAGLLLRSPSLGYATAAATTQPGEFHLSVAATSMAVALAGVGLAAFLYLGERREIHGLTYLFDFGWLRRAAELRWLRRLGELPLPAWLQAAASRVGLGWLTRGLGYLVLVVIGVLLSPLLVGYYLSPFKLSQHKFYVDEIYEAVIVRPLAWLAAGFAKADDGLIDGLVNGCGRVTMRAGTTLRQAQNGLIPFYSLAMVLAALLLFAAGWLWAGT